MRVTLELNPKDWYRILSYKYKAWRFKRIEEAGGMSYKDTDLIYAASTYCVCGAGMAYPEGCGTHHYWDCSDILTGRAVKLGEPGSVRHEGKLPFVFYEIKSERQPSAGGWTTRDHRRVVPAPGIGIFVNGQRVTMADKDVSYETLVVLEGYQPDRILSITYSTRRGGDEQRQGGMRRGQSVAIEEGMVFNVCDTSNA